MQNNPPAQQDAAPGSASLFALRAIGTLFIARWLYSMSESGFIGVLSGIGSSPIAMLHLLYIFLLIALPGARPGQLHPFQPLPRWLRQLIRSLSLLGAAFAIFSVVFFAINSGINAVLDAVRASNGWLVVAPLLYLTAAWLCRRRPVWRTRATAGRFAIGCFGVEINQEAGTATVWDQNRKIGQYAANEIALSDTRSGALSRFDLNWRSLAAAGHNRKRVFRVRTLKASERASALALETALKRMPAPPLLHPSLVTAPADTSAAHTATAPSTATEQAGHRGGGTEVSDVTDVTDTARSGDAARPPPTV